MSGLTSPTNPAAATRTAGAKGAAAELVSWFVLAAALLILPSFGSVYVIYMACLIAINVIATVGLNITVGYAGLLSIGHSAFVGVGAYASALIWLHMGTPLAVNIIVGACAAFAVGLVFGLPALRIKGVYLAIATLAAQYSTYFVFQQWTEVTGGDRGLSLPGLNVFGFGDTGFYYVVVLIALAACLAARNLFRTRVGRAFIAVREKDYAAEVLGINVVRTKLAAFGIGAAYAGISGALLAAFLRIVNPDQFTLAISVFFLAAVVVGGSGSVLGSILGAAFMTLMPELLRFLLESVSGPGTDLAGFLSPLRELIFGTLIVGFLIFEPRGLVGLVRRAFGHSDVVEARPEQ
jgi:branched-chain amino acid transport system permease protein